MIFKMRSNRGFSLLEVVISLLVITVGVLGLIKMQTYVDIKSENALKTLDALYIAEKQMELYQTRANDVSGSVGVIPFASMDDTNYCLTAMAATEGFTLLCNVGAPDPALSGALRSINVKVSWADRRGVSQAVSLDTSISKYSEFN